MFSLTSLCVLFLRTVLDPHDDDPFGGSSKRLALLSFQVWVSLGLVLLGAGLWLFVDRARTGPDRHGGAEISR